MISDVKGTTVAKETAHEFYVVQARFRNEPEIRSGESVIARNVSATVEFWSAYGEQLQDTFHGAWAISKAPDWIGWDALTDVVDLDASDVPGKLNIALWAPDAQKTFAFCKANLLDGAGRNSRFELKFGTYAVKVILRSAALEQEFWFKLNTPGPDAPLGLKAVSSPREYWGVVPGQPSTARV